MLHGYLACEKLSGLGCVIAISFRPHVKNPLFTYHIDTHFNYLAALAERNMDTITELPSFAYAGFTPSAHEEIDSTDADVQDIHLSEPVVPRPIHKAPTYPPGLQLPNLARYPITPPPTEPSVGRLYPSRGFRLQWPAGAIAPCPVEVASNEPAPRILEHNGARFKVTGELGSGSFGRVMRAFVLGPGEEEVVEVAIKVMNKDYLYRHAEGRDLVLKEKEAMERIMQASSCESVGLVGLVKAWCDEENIYFVMPLYHGDIYTLLEQRNLAHPSYAMRYIAAQLIQAIANAHSLGIMHRDIKPPNILISKTGHLVLADFGLAYVAPPGVDLAGLGFGVDSLCGTEVYEAPEMILMHIVSDYEHLTHELVPLPESEMLRYTCAVDVWAMGLVIYEIVVGSLNPWFHSSSREETRNRILAGSHKAFDWQAVESFDPLLADLLRRMLDYSPRRRITAEEAILHPYFQGIHWDILAERTSSIPFLNCNMLPICLCLMNDTDKLCKHRRITRAHLPSPTPAALHRILT
ncbi:kinase-like domain-containing protein [Irpex lacteus]|nr:kinase-like domain-containing protein [Irpex lacteus]